ncbi:VOC family protein [Pontibacter mangrovi]|uniref:Dioxygenase n=1 Tax=Pontibacter mangrovi TaxID=2589816 RepID=A0A501WCU7_9BACT|nr:VOC family protein [Pontibacter mangrovi]TPE46210.1 dioxygenase [Pontibacter mangrovi]
MNAFHYAFKVKDIASTRKFYVDYLGCREGRSTDRWIDFDFYGHQLSAHLSENLPELDYCGKVDDVSVPIPHFGCILTVKQFGEVQQRLEQQDVTFIIKPHLRYPGKPGEQYTMFVLDLSNNPLEFKAFTNSEEVFAS